MTNVKKIRRAKKASPTSQQSSTKATLLESRQASRTVLRFTPWAWAKLHFLCHHGDTEIGGFGITPPDDLLLIHDFVTVKQSTTCVSVAFDDNAVADFFEAQVEAGRKPEQFARHWCHTHPGDSPDPSAIDEDTFARVFGTCDWAVMFILARGGDTYARLRFNTGPTGALLVPVAVDYSVPFEASEHEAWKHEFDGNIHPEPLPGHVVGPDQPSGDYWGDDWPEELDPIIEDELLGGFEDADFERRLLDESEVIP